MAVLTAPPPCLIYYIENNERRIETLTSAEFCEMFAK